MKLLKIVSKNTKFCEKNMSTLKVHKKKKKKKKLYELIIIEKHFSKTACNDFLKV